MKNKYKKALAEVNIILENTEKEITNKIPLGFKNFIRENMDREHSITIDSRKKLIEQDLKKETKEILALIYRDYICTKEERQLLVLQEKEEQERIEKEKQERYNVDFNKITEIRRERNLEQRLEENQMSLIEVTEEKWYKKLINKILNIFKIKK